MNARSRLVAILLMPLAFLFAAGCASSGRQAIATTKSSAPQPPNGGNPGSSASYRAKPWYRQGMRTFGFESPTGNIRCALQSSDHTQLLCKTLNNGNAVDLDSLLEPDTNVTATIPAEPTLRYRRVWSSAHFYCWSRFEGVYCRSLDSTFGFKINRDGISGRVWKAPVLGGQAGGSGGLGTGGGVGTGGGGTTDGGSSGGGGASGGDFCSTHACISSFNDGSGYIVQCNDGMWSHSGGLSGACSYPRRRERHHLSVITERGQFLPFTTSGPVR